MKKLFFLFLFTYSAAFLYAQDAKELKRQKKEEKREKINELIRQEEEGVLVYSKQNAFGIFLRSNGYGFNFEKGKMKSLTSSSVYGFEFSEIKHVKEDKLPNGAFTFGNPYIYGKINNFYQLKLGYGQQRMLGQKGNKNGIAVSAVYSGGLSLGMLRPYYLEVQSQSGAREFINFKQDSTAFLTGFIVGGGGIDKGWGEIEVKPGVFAKGALRFDYGRYNEVVSGIEVGLSIEAYADKIPIMAHTKAQQLFFQGHIALLFGRRK
jgi:hypothetical protein